MAIGKNWCFGNKACQESRAARIEAEQAKAEITKAQASMLDSLADMPISGGGKKDKTWTTVGIIGAGLFLASMTFYIIKSRKG